MKQSIKTLNDVFDAESKQLEENFSDTEKSGTILKIKDDKNIFVKGITWRILRKEILKKLTKLLDIEIVKIIINGWIDNDYFEKINKIKDLNSEDSILLPIVNHTVKSSHHPYLEIIHNGVTIHKIDFEIKVDFHLRAINLNIQNKKIKEISSGECDIQGEFFCEKIRLLEAEIKNINLPGTLDLGKGITIIKN
jgi:hypothetical protein